MDRVTEYAKKVINGEIFAGKLHRLACLRHLNDLERQNTDEFPYYWDPEKSERILEYAETLIIGEGYEKKPVKLYGFQIFDLGCPEGWRNKKGFRKFRRAYESMARQNSKSFKNGIRGTYIAACCDYYYGKLFTAAPKKRQSKIAWDEMNKFIASDKDLSGEDITSEKEGVFAVKEYKSLIIANNTHCTIEALSKESGMDDGSRAIYASVDEYHQHKTNQIYKALYNGTKALKETFISVITTRGDKLNSPCHELDEYCCGILQGVFIAEDFFVDIYCLDKGDNIWDPKNLIKANPLLAANEDSLETLKIDLQTAKDMGGTDKRDFMTKVLNIWVNNTDESFTDAVKWKNCATNKKIDDMQGKKCYVGLDLSSGGDLTTISLEFYDGNKFYIYSHSFIPKGRLEEHIETDIAPYDYWERNNLITATGGTTEFKNDYKFIIKFLRDLIEKYDLKVMGIGYDPHNADGFLSDLEEFGVPLLQITQSARFLNDGTTDMQLNIKSGLVEYDEENELLSWSMVNAKIVKNSFGEIKVDKEPRARTQRIDPVDSAINAHITYMKLKEKEATDLNKEMENYLNMMGWR